jgi:PAS domain-containing protein
VRILLVHFPADDGSKIDAEVALDLTSLGLSCLRTSDGTWVSRGRQCTAGDADAPKFGITYDEELLPRILEGGAIDAVVWPRDRASLPFRILNALRVAEDRALTSFLRRLLDACPEAILVKSESGDVVYANARACSMHPAATDEVDDGRRAHVNAPDGGNGVAVFAVAHHSERRLRTG